MDKENAVSLWNNELVIPLLTSLKLAPGTTEYVQLMNAPSSSYSEDHNPSGIPLYKPSYPTAQNILKCSYCDSVFSTREEQVLHYSLDWHRFNLKRSIEGASSVTHEQFIQGTWKKQEEEEVDDCDGSSEEDEESNEEATESVQIQKKPRVFFLNADNELISIYRTVLQHKKSEFSSEMELLNRVSAARHKSYWVIVLAGGGHFAGAVFKGSEVIAHKTFHSYTVRAGQGGSQSSRDNKNATSHPRSAGASLRRYNELAYNEHVQELMAEWKIHLTMCHLIFCRCPKNNNSLLFGGQTPILSNADQRLRTIPFPSKKPTLSEVKKIHRNLSQIYVHGSVDVMEVDKERPPQKKGPVPGKTCAARGDKEAKKLTKGELAGMDTRPATLLGRSSSEEEVCEVTAPFQALSTAVLQSFGSSAEDERAAKRRAKSGSPKAAAAALHSKAFVNANESKDSSPEMRKVENFVYSACRTGSLYQLEALSRLNLNGDLTEVSDALPSRVVEAVFVVGKSFDFRAIQFGAHGKTPLHVSAESAHKDIIWWLLDQGSDPCVKTRRNETPYMACKTKEARNHFRRYMALHPLKYDYVKAKIPGPLTKEDEAEQKTKVLEKKRQQKKNKQERENEKKLEEDRKKKEEAEKEKYLRLSDREKRALAAEKRMQAVKSEDNKNCSAVRCFQCAGDLGPATPFQYLDFKFCSTLCVKEHRNKNKRLL